MISNIVEFPQDVIMPMLNDDAHFPKLSEDSNDKTQDDIEYENCLKHSMEFIKDLEDFVIESDNFLNKTIVNCETPNGKFYWDSCYFPEK